jgi:hypothetical protein
MLAKRLNTNDANLEEKTPEDCERISEKCDSIISKIKKKKKNKNKNNGETVHE